MAVNKVVYAGRTLVDLTGDSVTPDTLAEGVTAHDASGEGVTGTMTAVQYGKSQSLTTAQKTQARTNIGAASAESVSQLSAEIDAIGTQEEIVQQVIAALGTPVFGTIDENCVITLTGSLADGKTYTFNYEDEDGVVSTIGTYTKQAAPTYTNLLDVYTVDLNTRWSASSKAKSACNGMILLTLPGTIWQGATMRFKGFPGDIKTSDSNEGGFVFADSTNTKLDMSFRYKADGSNYYGQNIWKSNGTYDDNGVYSYKFSSETISNYGNASSVEHVYVSIPITSSGSVTAADLANLVITLNEPIV